MKSNTPRIESTKMTLTGEIEAAVADSNTIESPGMRVQIPGKAAATATETTTPKQAPPLEKAKSG